MPIHLLIINLCKFILRAWVIESYSLHHGCTLMHVCSCVWLLLVFVVDDIRIPLHVQQCMDHYTEGPVVLGHVASIVMPFRHSSLYWNGVMSVRCYSFSTLLCTYGYVPLRCTSHQLLSLHSASCHLLYTITIPSRLHHEMCSHQLSPPISLIPSHLSTLSNERLCLDNVYCLS